MRNVSFTAVRKILTFFAAFLMFASARGALALQSCGDCDGDGTVTIGEVVKGINNYLGQSVPAVCPSGLTNCSGVCRDLLHDNTNCGACGTVCPAGNVCSSGACLLSCQDGLTNCAGTCTKLQTDNANCGECGRVCPSGRSCSAGTCGCATDNDCASRLCSNGVCAQPGALNETDLPAEADFCNVQFPSSFSVQQGQPTSMIFGQIFEVGVTEAPGANPSVRAEVGFGPTGTDPRTAVSWTFFATTYNMQVGNNDEYQGSFTAPAVGAATNFNYVFRFSFDGGLNYTYCDVDGAGSNAGLTFDTTQLGVMTVTP